MLYPTELHAQDLGFAAGSRSPHGLYLSRQTALDPFGCIAWSCASSVITAS